MDKVDLQIAIELEKCLQPVQIPNTCSFWMIRTKSGVYYNEFIRNKYIAIGWNAVLKSALLEATEDNLHRLIETYYTDKQPGAALNKCRRFLENMKPGDIVMILGEKRVSFGIVGEYFEKFDINECIQAELEADRQIAAGLHKDQDILCPYVKRRSIQLIKEVEERRLTPLLARAMLNHHSLSEIDEYAYPILNTCFDLYTYANEMHLVFRVTTLHKIKGRDFSAFSYFINEIFFVIDEDEDISITTNLNSPGDYVVAFQKGMEFIQSNWTAFLFAFLVLFGGKFKGSNVEFDIPSVRGLIKYFINRQYESDKKDLELAAKKEEIKGLELENELKRIQIEKERLELAIQKMPSDADLQKLQKASQALELQVPDPKIIAFPSSNAQEDHKDGSS